MSEEIGPHFFGGLGLRGRLGFMDVKGYRLKVTTVFKQSIPDHPCFSEMIQVFHHFIHAQPEGLRNIFHRTGSSLNQVQNLRILHRIKLLFQGSGELRDDFRLLSQPFPYVLQLC